MKSFLEAFSTNQQLQEFIAQAQSLGKLRHFAETAGTFCRYVWGRDPKEPVDPDAHRWAYRDLFFHVRFHMDPPQPGYLYVESTKDRSEGSPRESVALNAGQALRVRSLFRELGQIAQDAAEMQLLRYDQEMRAHFPVEGEE